jgi:hypothetical protein
LLLPITGTDKEKHLFPMQCHVFKSKKPSSKQTQAAALASIAKEAISFKHKTK